MRELRAVLTMRSIGGMRRGLRLHASLLLLAALCAALVLVELGGAGAATAQAAAPDCPWVGSTASPDDRAKAVIARMTLDEKISMTGLTASPDGYENYTPAIPRLCVPEFRLQDGPAGVGAGFSGVTQLPAPISAAASFDRSAARSYGNIQADESWGKGIEVAQGPDVNIARVPENGRTFEAYGEDPFLTSEIGVANIDGIQSHGVMANVKHLVANNQETDRQSINEIIAQRTLREIYLPAFEASVKQGHVASAMCAYNQVNGAFQCRDPHVMNDIFKGEYGFDGFIRSDFGAVHGAAESFNAGMDQAKPEHNAELKAAVESGAVPMSRLDDAVRRVLREMFAYGLFDHPPTGTPDTVVTSPEHASTARDLAEEGTVLLKNADGALPLSHPRSIAVIGPDGGDGAYTAGGGSSHVRAPYVVTPYEGIKDRAGSGTQVTYTPGAAAAGGLPAVPSSALTPPSGDGNGLLGQYFNNQDRSGSPVLTRTDPNVDFTWGLDGDAESPGPGVNAEHWSGKWTGTLTAPATGEYKFSLTSDDGSELYIDGAKVVDDGGNHAVQSRQGTIDLTQGQKYSIEVDYFNNTGGDQVHLGWLPPGEDPYADVTEAARSADVAIVFANDVESEGHDRPDLSLPYDQDSMIEAAAKANPNTIVVLNTGSAVTMPWLADVRGVVEGWYEGQEDGNAIASILFGDVNPSGKLPLTFPKHESDTPAHTPDRWPGVGGVAQYSEGLQVGYRWYDAQGIEPLFPFGYGLSYTKFGVSDLVVGPKNLDVRGPGSHETISATVTNTGDRAGAEVVQLYVASPAAGEPPKALEGFRKVTLKPGESRRVSFTLTPRDVAYWDEAAHGWVTARGTYRVMVGTSSRDLPLTGSFDVQKATGPVSVATDAPGIVDAGSPATVTTTFTNDSDAAVHDVAVSLAAPDGWTVHAQSPSSFDSVAAGHQAQTRWEVTAPDDTPPGTYTLSATASYQSDEAGGHQQRSDDTTVQIPYKSLAAAYNNVGITDDADHTPGNLDGAGNSYSEQALTDAGLAPGATVVHDGITFTWPDVPAGTKDNVGMDGQVIRLSGSGTTLGLLGAGANGTHTASGTIVYADGTEQPFDLTLTDWFNSRPADGNELIATTSHLNRTNGKPPHTVSVFYAAIPLDAGKELEAIRLPAGGTYDMHAFAIGLR